MDKLIEEEIRKITNAELNEEMVERTILNKLNLDNLSLENLLFHYEGNIMEFIYENERYDGEFIGIAPSQLDPNEYLLFIFKSRIYYVSVSDIIDGMEISPKSSVKLYTYSDDVIL